METHMSAKGQIVIPAKVRRMFGLKEGTRIQVDMDADSQRIILTPVTRAFVQALRGKYRGTGLLKALAADKKRERER